MGTHKKRNLKNGALIVITVENKDIGRESASLKRIDQVSSDIKVLS
jgi:hypothetical protein